MSNDFLNTCAAPAVTIAFKTVLRVVKRASFSPWEGAWLFANGLSV